METEVLEAPMADSQKDEDTSEHRQLALRGLNGMNEWIYLSCTSQHKVINVVHINHIFILADYTHIITNIQYDTGGWAGIIYREKSNYQKYYGNFLTKKK